MAYIYGSFANVKLSKLPLLFSLLLAGTCCLVGGAAAGDYDLNLHVYPNPFVAGRQYGDDYAMIAFNVPSGGTASIYIYDFEGNRVRTLLEGIKKPPGEGKEKWDGRDDKSNLIAPGPYVVVLELTIQGELYRDTFVAVAHR
jgi:hypothetical protein